MYCGPFDKLETFVRAMIEENLLQNRGTCKRLPTEIFTTVPSLPFPKCRDWIG